MKPNLQDQKSLQEKKFTENESMKLQNCSEIVERGKPFTDGNCIKEC